MTKTTGTATLTRSRTLSSLAGLVLPTGIDQWRVRRPSPQGMPSVAFGNHNSIVPTTGFVADAMTAGSKHGYGAAKQAAPPRGVPR